MKETFGRSKGIEGCDLAARLREETHLPEHHDGADAETDEETWPDLHQDALRQDELSKVGSNRTGEETTVRYVSGCMATTTHALTTKAREMCIRAPSRLPRGR